MNNTRRKEVEELLKIPVAIKRDQEGRGWVYLIYFATLGTNRSIMACSINGDAKSLPMQNKRICRAKYAMLNNVPLSEADQFLEQFCNYYGLDKDKFVLVTKMPTLQLD